MKRYSRKLIIAAIALFLAYTLVPTISFGPDPRSVLIVVGGLFAIAAIVKPVFNSVMLPVNFLTLGFMSVILNFIFLLAITRLLPGFSIGPYSFPGAFIQGVIIPQVSLNQIATTGAVAAIITLTQRLLPIIL